ncbi:hypothetical protein ACFQH9_06980 [Pseudonocardia lutea]|uniref:Uncharacterized protein n=1 Tax=Pseudonocardia lutea TaxID=2172015 RepID=A0ABW1I6L5_9PSEU
MGRLLSEIAFDEQHAIHDVKAAVDELAAPLLADPARNLDEVVEDDGTDRPEIATPDGTYYLDQRLTDHGDHEVCALLDKLRSGGGTPDHPGV